MKLAEALKRRADNQTYITELKGRLDRSAKVQEGSEPFEDVGLLLTALDLAIDNQVSLVERINHTNAVVTIARGLTMTSALALRDSLLLKRKILADLVNGATNSIHDWRSQKSELRTLVTFSVQKVQNEIDALAGEIRVLDLEIQQTNWTADFIE